MENDKPAGPVGALLDRVGIARAEVIEPQRSPAEELAQLDGVQLWLGWLQVRLQLIAKEHRLIDACKAQLQDAARQTDPLKAARYLAQLAHMRREIEDLRGEPHAVTVLHQPPGGSAP